MDELLREAPIGAANAADILLRTLALILALAIAVLLAASLAVLLL